MPSFLLYGLTVLIWGTSWYAITLQTGVVPVEVSIAYRFLLAASMLLLFCFATGRRLSYRPRDHLFMAAQGICLFSSTTCCSTGRASICRAGCWRSCSRPLL